MNIGKMGIHQRSALDSYSHRVGDSDAVDTTPTTFHRPGLVVSDWASMGEGSLASPVAQIRDAVVCRCGHRLY
jgi:hypothetical protein